MKSTWFFVGFLVVFAASFISNVVYLYNIRKFSNYLRNNHPNDYNSFSQMVGNLGLVSQGIFAVRKNTRPLWVYFKEKQYEKLNDEHLNKIGNRSAKGLILGAYLIPLLILLFILGIIYKF